MAKSIIGAVVFDVDYFLMIADPCYVDTDDKERGAVDVALLKHELGAVIPNAGGRWEATVEREETRFFSHESQERVAKLRAKKHGAHKHGKLVRWPWRLGVDSGQMYVADAGMFGLDYNDLLSRYSSEGLHPDDERWYETYKDDMDFFGYREGAISSTGYGDGSYNLDIYYDQDDKPYQIEVTFIEDEEEDDNDHYDDGGWRL